MKKKKYFGTDGIRGAINSKNINGNMFFKFGLASGTYFKLQKKRKQIGLNMWQPCFCCKHTPPKIDQQSKGAKMSQKELTPFNSI